MQTRPTLLRPQQPSRSRRQTSIVYLTLHILALLIAAKLIAQAPPYPKSQVIVVGEAQSGSKELAAIGLDDGFIVAHQDPELGSEQIGILRLGPAGRLETRLIAATEVGTADLRLAATDQQFVLSYLRAAPFQEDTLRLLLMDGTSLDIEDSAELGGGDFQEHRSFSRGSGPVLISGDRTGVVVDFASDTVSFPLPVAIDRETLFSIVPTGDETFLFFSAILDLDGTGSTIERSFLREDQVLDNQILIDTEVAGQLQALRVGDGYLLVWQRPTTETAGLLAYRALRLNPDGEPRGVPVDLGLASAPGAELTALAEDGNGVVWSLWRDGSRRRLARVKATGSLSSLASAHVDQAAGAETVTLAAGASGALVTWIASDSSIRAQVYEECPSGGNGTPPSLCLQDGQFTLQLEWEVEDGRNGVGLPASAGSSEAGIFTFFNPENWEFLVKVLNGCGINGRWWVFAAPTTGAGFELTVTQTATGDSRSYSNSVGVLPTVIADTGAFPCE